MESLYNSSNNSYNDHHTHEVCMICGKQFKNLFLHVSKSHNMTKKEYCRKYWRHQYLNELKLDTLNNFYISYRKSFIRMFKDTSIYAVKQTLFDSYLNSHINYTYRIGICFGKTSNLIGLDLDTLDTGLLEEIYDLLITLGIPESSILITSSGNKGFHIDIFLREHVSIDMIKDFYNLALYNLDLDSTTLELRGGSKSGYFLPFGINFKGKSSKTKGYCDIVNQFGLKLDMEGAISKLECLSKVDSDFIKEILEINDCSNLNYQETNNSINYDSIIKEDISDIAEILEKNELCIYNNSASDIVEQIGSKTTIVQGTRHNLALVYAIAMRESNFSSLEIEEKLLEWHRNLVSGYKSSFSEIKRDCKYIVKSVFTKREKGIGYKYSIPKRMYKLYITKSDIEQFQSMDQSRLRRLFLAMKVHANKYADNEGVFYMTYEQMGNLLGLASIERPKELNNIKTLESLGLIEIVSRDNYKAPNKYRFTNFDREPDESDIYYFENYTSNSIYEATKALFSRKQIRSRFENLSSVKEKLKCIKAA